MGGLHRGPFGDAAEGRAPSVVSASHGLARGREVTVDRGDDDGWIFVAFGVLVPFVALWGAIHGWGVREASPRAGWSLLVAGVAVFTVRLALWLG